MMNACYTTKQCRSSYQLHLKQMKHSNAAFKDVKPLAIRKASYDT